MNRWMLVSVALAGTMAGMGCAGAAGAGGAGTVQTAPAESGQYVYRVARLVEPVAIDARWDKPVWRNVPAAELTHFMGERPAHFPRTQARLGYDAEALYVIFRVEDRYVRTVTTRPQGPVCRDSCVEFFFTPGEDPAVGYFNLEMNCGGTMLLRHQVIPWKDSKALGPADLERIEVAHSLPRVVDPEIAGPTVWTVEYRVPFDVLAAYCPGAVRPAPGVRWRANLYKCADATSHPHWLTWAPVSYPRPNFHLPQYFGVLAFE